MWVCCNWASVRVSPKVVGYDLQHHKAVGQLALPGSGRHGRTCPGPARRAGESRGTRPQRGASPLRPGPMLRDDGIRAGAVSSTTSAWSESPAKPSQDGLPAEPPGPSGSATPFLNRPVPLPPPGRSVSRDPRRSEHAAAASAGSAPTAAGCGLGQADHVHAETTRVFGGRRILARQATQPVFLEGDRVEAFLVAEEFGDTNSDSPPKAWAGRWSSDTRGRCGPARATPSGSSGWPGSGRNAVNSTGSPRAQAASYSRMKSSSSTLRHVGPFWPHVSPPVQGVRPTPGGFPGGCARQCASSGPSSGRPPRHPNPRSGASPSPGCGEVIAPGFPPGPISSGHTGARSTSACDSRTSRATAPPMVR